MYVHVTWERIVRWVVRWWKGDELPTRLSSLYETTSELYVSVKEVCMVWDERNNRESMGSRCEEMIFFPKIGSTRGENEKEKKNGILESLC